MEIFGSPESIKQGIDEKYKSMLRAEQEKILSANRIAEQEFKEEKGRLELHYKSLAEQKTNAERSKILNDMKARAKQKFELERERLLESAISETEKSLESALSGKEYAAYINRALGNAKVSIASSEASIKGKLKNSGTFRIDKNIKGIIATSDNEVHDLTVSAIISEKRQELRELLAKELFGE